MIPWAYPILKAVVIGLVAYGVIGDTGRALIVATVSGFMGIIAVAVGQSMAGRNADKVLEAAQKNQELLQQIEQLTHDQTAKLDKIKEQTNGEHSPKD